MIQYNKLVRDKIPDIIRASGKQCLTSVLSDGNFINALEKKLDEEVAEYHASKEIDELADILTVVYALAKAKGYTQPMLEAVINKKLHERGGFDDKIFLKSVTE